MCATKEKGGRSHNKLIGLIEEHNESEGGISIMVNHKSKQSKKLHPTQIYLDNCSTYNQI